MRTKQQICTDKESIFIGAVLKILKLIEKANMPQMKGLIPAYTYEVMQHGTNVNFIVLVLN